MKNHGVSKFQLVQYVHFSKDEVEWHETDAGYKGQLGDTTVFVAGGDLSVCMLTISSGYDKVVIYEPMATEDAPIYHWIRGFKKHVLRREPAPLSAQAQITIKIKQMINEILTTARKQCSARWSDPGFENKLYRRIWRKLTGDQDER